MRILKYLLGLTLFIAVISSCNKVDENISLGDMVELRSIETDMPIIQNGILKFTSKEHLSDFIDETIVLDDNERLELETSLGFTSLYSIINSDDGEYILPDFDEDFVVNGKRIYERNSIYQTVFNENHELWVGDEVYKYVDEGLVARSSSSYVSRLLSIRNNPQKIVQENVELIDIVRDSIINTDKVQLRSQCQMIVTNPYETPVNSGTKYLRPQLITGDGEVFDASSCGGNITIDWGDDHTDYYTNTEVRNVRAHIYDIPSTPGECKTYTATVTIEFDENSLCAFPDMCLKKWDENLVFTGYITFTVCNDARCEIPKYPEWQPYGIVYNNGNNRADFRLGINLKNTLWNTPKAWGRIIHYKKKKGKWKKSKPNHKLEITIHGTAYRGDCTTTAEPKYGQGSKKTKDLKYTHRITSSSSLTQWKDYYLRTDDNLFIDWKVFHLSSTTPEPVELNYPFLQ